VEALASIMCTNAEIAAVLDCSSDTLERRFTAVLEKGRLKGKQSLRRKQYQLAMDGNATLLIWLGKQHLGQSERQETALTGGVNLTNTTETPAQIVEAMVEATVGRRVADEQDRWSRDN
jgi:hypothetical protein